MADGGDTGDDTEMMDSSSPRADGAPRKRRKRRRGGRNAAGGIDGPTTMDVAPGESAEGVGEPPPARPAVSPYVAPQAGASIAPPPFPGRDVAPPAAPPPPAPPANTDSREDRSE